MSVTPACQDAYRAFLKYLSASAERDMAAVEEMFASGHSGFGTGMDEIALNRGRALYLIEREFKQVDNQTSYQARLLAGTQVSETLCVLMALVTHKLAVLGEKEVFGPMRYSVVMQQEADFWKVLHLHISVPWGAQGRGESYPLQKVEEKNKLLREAVYLKTRQLEKTLVDMAYLTTIDQFTGAINRTRFEELVDLDIKRIKRYGDNASLIMLDIDHYKRVNDTYGHMVGDRVIIEFVQVVQSQLREADTLARWGGDEFSILLPRQSLEMAIRAAERIRQAVADHDFGVAIEITASQGVGQYHPGDNLDTWLKRVDDLLYVAKKRGRNLVVWDEEMLALD
ncbi:MAG: hypothetical protein Kow002_14500 [Anaerolineales bacterium]